jgi:hypothetical protein
METYEFGRRIHIRSNTVISYLGTCFIAPLTGLPTTDLEFGQVNNSFLIHMNSPDLRANPYSRPIRNRASFPQVDFLFARQFLPP